MVMDPFISDPFISDPGRDWRPPEVRWPDGKTFAFTVFDDPDFQSVDLGKPVYDFLADLGLSHHAGNFSGPAIDTFRRPHLHVQRSSAPSMGAQPERVAGFEMGWHGASPGTSTREQTVEGLERFRQCFGQWPVTASQHYECMENMYWGDERLSSASLRLVYNLPDPLEESRCLSWPRSGASALLERPVPGKDPVRA